MRTYPNVSVSVAVLSFLLLASCGESTSGSGDNLGASGVDSSKRLTTLSNAERGQVCDWMVAKAGSYGNPGTCDRTQPAANHPFLAYDNQAACVEDSPDETETGCLATIAQLETCVNLLPMCATLTEVANMPACAVLSDC